MIKVVIDTGVTISALLKKDGTSRKALTKAIYECVPLLGMNTLSELEEVMGRPKFEKYFSFEEKMAMLELMIQHGMQVEVVSTFSVCRDQNDDKFLNLAIDGKADVVLTRDPDLLVLHPFQGIPILNPTDFLAWVENKGNM